MIKTYLKITVIVLFFLVQFSCKKQEETNSPTEPPTDQTEVVVSGQDFKIISNTLNKRRAITDTIRSGEFVLGIDNYGGGYITEIDIPGIGNIMGVITQRYGRGGQSSIRDMGRGGQYNPTQAGFSDVAGTECEVLKSPGKLVVNPRGCCLFNGDANFDYIRWENIAADPFKKDGGNIDVDNIDEENLSVTIDGKTYTKQEAEVYSDFDFYCEYENFQSKAGLSIPAVRHYFEYRFIRSSTLPNSCMKQFNKSALMKVGRWNENEILSDISTKNPEGIYAGGVDNLNSISLSWSIRNDVAIWDPEYRYVQLINGNWQIENRGNKQFMGDDKQYKLRFIVAESNNENSGNALGFYLPESNINKFNIVGVNESDGSEAYVDERFLSNFYLDIRYRIPNMSWMGFRSEIKGLIDRSKLIGIYDGVYEKLRQESICLIGTPAQIKAAFIKLDKYYSTATASKSISN